MSASIDLEQGRVSRAEDGVIQVRWKAGAVVQEPDIVAVLDAQALLLRGERALVLVDARSVRSMTRTAQRLTAEHPSAARTDGVAIVVDGPVSRLLGNFFLSVTRPTYPTRLFAEPDEALAWLRGLRV